MEKRVSPKKLIVISAVAAIALALIAVCVGSVRIPIKNVVPIIISQITGKALPDGVLPVIADILLRIRIPRVLLAFIVGASLGVSGVTMQSVLRNPLASSYTIGVSAGASLAVGLLMLFKVSVPLLGIFAYPIIGCACGIGAVALSVSFASSLDKNLSNNTIVLVGMVFSLFITAIITIISALNRTVMERLTFWQMGSFSMKEWTHVYALFPIALALTLILFTRRREMDILTFGDEQAALIGVNVKREKWLLLFLASALTGASVAFVGAIGFVDLVAPHIARRMFGAPHRLVLPMTAVIGGGMMVLADLLARIAIKASELPVGAVTALIGAPFFLMVFFRQRRKSA